MDQVRTILKLIWRERFWVLSVVAVLVAFVCWHMSSSALDTEFSSRKGAIETQFNSMRTLSSEQNHPNNQVNDANREQAREQSKNVLAVWQQLYERQRKEVLSWPKDNLKPEFIEAIEKLKFRDPFPPALAEDMRNHYWNYIEKRFDALLDIVKALPTNERGISQFGGGEDREAGFSRFEGDGGNPGAPQRRGATADEQVNQDYLVEWRDQNNLRAKLQFKDKPTPVQIWVTQEDLWVFESLLNVIAETNKKRGATRPDNTAVRIIENLEVGKAAAIANRQKGSIIMPQSGAGPEGMEGGDFSGGEAPMERFDESAGGEEGGDSSEAADLAFLANRYLDPEGNPYPSGPEDKEFRRLPVRMRLLMDQRYLPQLLVECANAALPVEVKQVRVNPEASGAGFAGAARGSARTGIKPARSQGDGPEDPNLAEVEIRGVVYIYNQPDETIFEGLGAEDEQLADAAAAE